MQGAGKRICRPPVRFNPSDTNSPVLPSTDFDISLAMSNASDMEESNNISLNPQVRPSDDIRALLVQFHAETQAIAKQSKTDNENLKSHLTDSLNLKITEFRKEVHAINSDCLSIIDTNKELCNQYTDKRVAEVRKEMQSNMGTLNDRLCLVEGQSSRLIALEQSVKKLQFDNNTQTSNNNPQPSAPLSEQPHLSRYSFNNAMSSTINCQSENCPPKNPTAQPFSFIPSSFSPSNNLNNTSILSLEHTKIPEFNGNLTPLHPEEFLLKVNAFFQLQNISEIFKINLISDKLTSKAKLWFNSLIPSPVLYNNFVGQFREHFWSASRQRSIRNELYRPYSHRNPSTLQEHAIEWVNKAKFLNPPIDQIEMVDQIISHFNNNISLSLRGLRLQSTNELIQQLSYLEYTNSNYQANINSNSSQNFQNSQSGQNSNNRNPSNHNYYNRYTGRQNNNAVNLPNHNDNSNNTNNDTPNASAGNGTRPAQ